MNPPPSNAPAPMPRVYLLPNLMTAGNLFCGFMATIQIIAGSLEQQAGSEAWIRHYETSLKFILGAFIFDMLDGRLARFGGRESAFGREFDSLADLISFGLAPALLVVKIILADFPPSYRWVGGLVAFIYLVAGAMRLARFNLVSSQAGGAPTKDFIGFPIPAAAGLVASITLFLLTLYEHDREPGRWRYGLPVLLLFLSFMMYSRITYPSFKSIDWHSRRSIPQLLVTVIAAVLLFKTWRYSLALVFIAYLVYGFVRPFISKRIREGIEEAGEEEPAGEREAGPPA